MSTRRRNFLKAFGVGGAATAIAAATSVAAPTVAPTVKIVEREKLVWPDTLPPLVNRDGWPTDGETWSEETHRLLTMLLAADREVLTMPHVEDITWNGLTFRLVAGPNIVPSPIAGVWKQREADIKAGNDELFGRVASKYSHTFRG